MDRNRTGDLDAVKELWREYWDSLGLDDGFQGFAAELDALPEGYCVLIVERVDGIPAGTAALRILRDGACELKRMYVRARYRGRGIARKLLARAIEEARAFGAAELRADTLPEMTSALSLYRQAGFSETGPYSENPTPGAIFLRLAI